MNPNCGCSGQLLPDPDNRPGLDAIVYRAGTHFTFLEAMKSRLADQPVLRGLSKRDGADFSIALLDAWAMVADVLTFYQERIANEGYLRTATERMSILELARLIGYELRPGVASSVYLSYTIDTDRSKVKPPPNFVDIPIGSRAQSIPGPGELPQAFETSVLLKTSDIWNNLKVRTTRPHQLTPNDAFLYFKGITTNLKPGDRLLFDFGDTTAIKHNVVVRFILTVEPDNDNDRTRVTLEALKHPPVMVEAIVQPFMSLLAATQSLTNTFIDKPSDDLPISPVQSPHPNMTAFDVNSDLIPRLKSVFNSEMAPQQIYAALENVSMPTAPFADVYVFRTRASPFGANAPKKQNFGANNLILDPVEWPLNPEFRTAISDANRSSGAALANANQIPIEPTEKANMISLDNVYDKIVPDGWILLEDAAKKGPLVSRIKDVKERSRADYGISGKITEVELDTTWIDLSKDLSAVRNVAVFVQSEKLALAEFPIDPIKEPIAGNSIELNGIYPGLESGRCLILSGIRNDLKIPDVELVKLAGVEQKPHPNDPGAKRHTFLTLAADLANTYDPNSVSIYGNVVQATHGETRVEVLGSGDASRPLQEFQLKQFPLTYISAATHSGIETTLNVRVNNILWHEAAGLASLGPNDRCFLTRTGDDSKTSIIFGNGVRGARVPTGVENIKAVYRTGIGKPGNVKAEQISILSTKPLGVKEVINPMRASGGADRESRDQARRNAPLAVMSLDRLVSTQDFADFARTFAGVTKAVATQIAGRVHVTIAGADGIPIDETSELFRNLETAFEKFGDPQQPMQLEVYKPMLLYIQAKVAILPDYQFETVAPKIRSVLIAAFAFDNRDLGQDVLRSDIIATIQNVEGVQFVDLDRLETISENLDLPKLEQPMAGAKLKAPFGLPISPTQLAYLTPDISETLILTELVNAR